MKGKNKFFIILILGLLSAIGPFSIDMYLPGFPAIAADLHSTTAYISLSLSSFFIGISLGQLLYGPLLDRYGRKNPLYFGLVLYVLSSIGCALCKSADALIAIRLLQAFGGCVGMVAARAMVRDIFPVEENAKIFSSLMLVVAVSPIIAPTTGGYVTAIFGWQSIFIILAAIGFITLIAVYFALPESRKPNAEVSLLPAPIIKSFLEIFTVPQFYTYAFTGSIAAAGLYAYIAGSPHVFMELYHVTGQQYGWIFATVAGGLITSSQINTLVLRKYKSEQIILVALLCQSVAGLLLFIGSMFHLVGLFSTIFLILIFLSCQGFTFPNSSALSMAPFTKNAGRASALMGAIQLSMGAFTSALVSLLHNETALPMAGVMAACAVISFIVLLLGNKVIYRNSIKATQEESAELIITT
ncbi:MAG: multidrug effflux MFS transporter [Bacteroidota bacterium]|nr:multidrug effflux MFS transporter [Bacteroidota bacterium]